MIKLQLLKLSIHLVNKPRMNANIGIMIRYFKNMVDFYDELSILK